MSLESYLSKNYGIKGKGKVKKIKKKVEKIQKQDIKPKVEKPQTSNQQETVFRNEKGQIININDHLKQQANKEKQLELKKIHKNYSEVDDLKDKEFQQSLENVRTAKVNVTSDDKQLNEERQQHIFEDDPMLMFDNKHVTVKEKVSKTGRKLYKGVPPVNRFNIVPGHRWDGVDRSNGFELKWFDRQYEKD